MMAAIVLIVLNAFLVTSIILMMVANSRHQRLRHPSCGACGYNLTGHPDPSAKCPECGGLFLNVGIVRSREKPYSTLFVLALLLIAAELIYGLVYFLGWLATRAALGLFD